MVEVDTEAELGIERAGSVTVVLIPLAGAASKTWRAHFKSVDSPPKTSIMDHDDRAWIRVVIQESELGDSDATLERLEEILQLVALANQREAEREDRWADFDDRLRSWWGSRSKR